MKKLIKDQASRGHTPKQIGEAQDIPAKLAGFMIITDLKMTLGGK